MRKYALLLFLLSFTHAADAQLKFVIEDFEGFAEHPGDLKPNGIFNFGNIKVSIDTKMSVKQSYSGDRSIKILKAGTADFGGWGKGVGLNVELDVNQDYLNFYYYQPASNENNSIKVELQEDDNENKVYDKGQDDSWTCVQKLETKNKWELISIPLNKFKDENQGGDGMFNVGYKHGKLLCFIISFENSSHIPVGQTWSFDFICFSKGKLPTGPGIFDPATPGSGDGCAIGTWSKEGNTANFSDIASTFEGNFKPDSDKKLGVVHFFQPFAVDGGNTQNFYPSVDRINKVIEQGYIPMVTLEDHFVNANPNIKQPNLYSIVEGYFDSFFADWAKQIKQVKGVVLLRILHEFNGDWYPWCIAHNDKNPEMLIKAFQHIRKIFNAQGVTNVKFIWCPNSMSFPQERWNYIMDAYPGDEFVDFVGLDIYNGAGKGVPVWRSFRKEGIENYFILTQQLPSKPLLVCETASRERNGSESQTAQTKAQWIMQMSDALCSDMSKVKLLAWFNEKETFKVNSSAPAQKAYLNYVLKREYFKSGTEYLYSFIK